MVFKPYFKRPNFLHFFLSHNGPSEKFRLNLKFVESKFDVIIYHLTRIRFHLFVPALHELKL